jgi:hypothetical protein
LSWKKGQTELEISGVKKSSMGFGGTFRIRGKREEK